MSHSGNTTFKPMDIEEKADFAKGFRDRLLHIAQEEKDMILEFFRQNIHNDKSTDDDSEEEHVDDTNGIATCATTSEAKTNNNRTHAIKVEDEIIDVNDWLQFPAMTVRNGRLDYLRMCIKTGYDLDKFIQSEYDDTLLQLAVSQEELNFNIVKELIKHTDVNFQTGQGNVLFSAIKCDRIGKEQLKLLSILVENGVDLKSCQPFFQLSPVHQYITSLSRGEFDQKYRTLILDLLTPAGIDINTKDIFGKTPLHHFVGTFKFYVVMDNAWTAEEQMSMFAVIDHLVKKGADINTQDTSGHSLLHTACDSLNVSLIQKLIDMGCSVNSVCKAGLNPVYHLCVQYGCLDGDIHDFIPVLERLIQAGCDLNAPCENKSTVLHFCAAKGHHTFVKFLMEKGADINKVDHLQRTALHVSARSTDMESIVLLAAAGTNINIQDIYQYTPVHYASMYANCAALNTFLSLGGKVDVPGILGVHPLHLAVERGDEELINTLIQAGANVNCFDHHNATPLHYAAFDGYPEAVKALLSHGADLNATDDSGATPLSLALKMGQHKVALTLAEDVSHVKFGDLETFPHCPAIPGGQVEEYFQKITTELKNIGTVDKVMKSILTTDGLSRVDVNTPGNQHVVQTINTFVQDVITKIGEIDPRFAGRLMESGSVYEGARIGYPDEFDYMVRLEKFEDLVDHMEEAKPMGFMKLKTKPVIPEEYKEYVTPSGHLNAHNVYMQFRKLVLLAKFEVYAQGQAHIYSGYQMIDETKSSLNNTLIPEPKLISHFLTWRSSAYKCLDISLDINAVLFQNSWPEITIKESGLMKQVSKRGIYVLPKRASMDKEHSMTDNDMWRLSFSHIELEIFNTIPEVLRDAYGLIKAFRIEPLCPPVEQTYSHLFNEQGKPIGREDEDDDECSSDALVEEAPGEEESSNEEGTSAGGEGGTNESLVQHEVLYEREAGDDMPDTLMGWKSTSEPYIDPKYLEELEGCDLDEITCESCIPTFYLKQLFLYEAEQIQISMIQHEPESILLDVPLSVYRKLQKAIETEELYAYFIPTQNLYQPPDKYDNTPQARQLTKQYCQNIIKMLESLK